VPDLLSRISAICPLLPGDVVFTGTPAGTGICAQPPTFLQAGDVLETTIEGIGTIGNAVCPVPPADPLRDWGQGPPGPQQFDHAISEATPGSG
jgi:hypothetical protein